MRNAPRKIAFVLAAADHGTLIVNRFDYHAAGTERAFGVGLQILRGAAYDPQEVDLAMSLLELRRRHFGDGVMAIDCGANIGVHTIEWAKRMTGWGSVLAIEAQERIFYALAGNIAINNCFNARAVFAAVAAGDGRMRIPTPDYQLPASFGSLELRPRDNNEFIGQNIDYSDAATSEIRTLALDGLGCGRVDLIKIDIEGMEEEALAGATALVARTRPILIIEWLKSARDRLEAWLRERDYRVFQMGINLLAIHAGDPSLSHVKKLGAPTG
ncbi:MAG TPA: FkbM family methyltransferase [Stellaceae bacterium]|nr:FkbM family methyltransferase [Stellaceae bacterium]